MRQLATIKTISNLVPIEGKDRIVLALIDGWQVIVQKDEYIVDDKTVFVEIDAVLPERPEFEFLRKRKFRIKTLKLGGVLSQGICFPLSILPKGEYAVGDDVTNVLGIKQYEATRDVEPTTTILKRSIPWILKPLMRFAWFRKLMLPKKADGFPSFISKTDETRIQNMPHVLVNKAARWRVREKVDGQSGTFFLKKTHNVFGAKHEFGVASRNRRLWTPDDSTYWFVANKYKLKDVLRAIIDNHEFVAIQGECVGPRVQGNKYKVKEPDLYCFNLIYPSGKVDCLLAEQILEEYGLKWCPLVADEYVLPDTVNELLDYATGKSQLQDTLREGIVLRNYERNVSFKAVSPDFLIKYDE